MLFIARNESSSRSTAAPARKKKVGKHKKREELSGMLRNVGVNGRRMNEPEKTGV